MALVKTAVLADKKLLGARDEPGTPARPTPGVGNARRAEARSRARREKAAERIAAATEELASGIAEGAMPLASDQASLL